MGAGSGSAMGPGSSPGSVGTNNQPTMGGSTRAPSSSPNYLFFRPPNDFTEPNFTSMMFPVGFNFNDLKATLGQRACKSFPLSLFSSRLRADHIREFNLEDTAKPMGSGALVLLRSYLQFFFVCASSSSNWKPTCGTC